MNTDTTVSQTIPDQSTTKTYATLRRGDVIYSYVSNRYGKGRDTRPYYVFSKKQKGDLIEVELHPCIKTIRKASLVSATFRADYPVTVVTSFDSQALETRDERAARFVLETLQDHIEPRTAWDLWGLQSHKEGAIAVSKIKAACKKLKAAGQIIERKDGIILRYRLPIPKDAIGLPVIELKGTPSEQLGWISDWKTNKSNGLTYPIVTYFNGSYGFSTEDRLDPLAPGLLHTWVCQVRDRTVPTVPSDAWVPNELISQIDCRRHALGVAQSEPMKAIAEWLGLSENGYNHTARTKTVEHLNRFYPGWKYGYNHHNRMEKAIA